MGKILIFIGVIILVAGVVIYVSEKINLHWWAWFGNLPGDIKIEREHFKFYFPFTSMLIVSAVISIIIKLLKKFL